jgi:hypothetical protein
MQNDIRVTSRYDIIQNDSQTTAKFFKKSYPKGLYNIKYAKNQETKQKYSDSLLLQKKTFWHGNKFIQNRTGWIPLPDHTLGYRIYVDGKNCQSNADR